MTQGRQPKNLWIVYTNYEKQADSGPQVGGLWWVHHVFLRAPMTLQGIDGDRTDNHTTSHLLPCIQNFSYRLRPGRLVSGGTESPKPPTAARMKTRVVSTRDSAASVTATDTNCPIESGTVSTRQPAVKGIGYRSPPGEAASGPLV